MNLWGLLPRRWQAARARRRGDDLVILDDFFPNLLTGFRVAEYNALMQAMPGLRVFSAVPEFAQRHAEYAQRHPEPARRVLPWPGQLPAGVRRVYLNFLNNAVMFLPALQAAGVPFWLTLYPGGGFGLREPASDDKLLSVLRSPLLQGLTITQPVTGQYVRHLCGQHGLPVPRILEVPGVVVNPLYFEAAPASPEASPASALASPSAPVRGTTGAGLHIAFVAEKYMPEGLNKGYPAFIEAMQALRDEPGVHWHVVGSFGPQDSPGVQWPALVPGPEGRLSAGSLTWHGRLHTAELRRFLHGVDVVVSPNRPFCLHPGNFDGFPTGACVEASLCGALIVASDELNQNPGYVDGQDIVLIEPTAQAVERALRGLLRAPEPLRRMAAAGQARTRELYHPRRQIGPRLNLLRKWKVWPPHPTR